MNVMGRVPASAPPSSVAETDPLPAPSWRPALIVLGLGLAAWALLFAEEIAAAVRLWNASTAYNHCWLIGPIAAWLFWQRRHRLPAVPPAPLPAAALLAIPGSLAWFAAERMGIMEGRQLAAFGLAQVLVLSILGWRFVRAFIGPLAYLVFLVPFGGFAVGPLQHITARLIDWGLDPLGITHYVDGLLIDTPAGQFHVAEACAGLRFIIAALAFGALYALVIFRSPWRRLIVMGLALAVPILANGVRAGGIIVVAEYLGSAEAAAADHIIYGWGFFSVVLLLLILAGLPFREDSKPLAAAPRSRMPRPAPRPARLATALLPAVLLTASGPVLAAGLSRGADQPMDRTARLAPVPGCEPAADGTLSCGGMTASAKLFVFSPRVTWSEVSAVRWRMVGSDQDLTFTVRVPGGGVWQARQGRADQGTLAMAVWLEGSPAGGGVSTRLAQARNSVLGDGGRPVLVVLQLRPEPGAAVSTRDRALLEAVLAGQPALLDEAAQVSRGR
jgi:exosortase A